MPANKGLALRSNIVSFFSEKERTSTRDEYEDIALPIIV